MPLGIVVGLVDEGRIAGRLGLPVIAGGGTAAGAEVAAERLVEEGATSLLSFGLCGGLDPSLLPGAVVIPRVVVASGYWRADARLLAWLGGATVERLFGATAPVASAAEKRGLWMTRAAAAVDLESGAVASAATRGRLPFAVLRAVCDPAEREVPATAIAAVSAAGEVRIGRLLGALLAEPRQISGLLRLAADARAARRALVDRVHRLPPPPLP
jgi:adenosylhomocysteine nucleosidase